MKIRRVGSGEAAARRKVRFKFLALVALALVVVGGGAFAWIGWRSPESRKALTEADFEEILGKTHDELMPRINASVEQLRAVQGRFQSAMPGGLAGIGTHEDLRLAAEETEKAREIVLELERTLDEYERRVFNRTFRITGSHGKAQAVRDIARRGLVVMREFDALLRQGLENCLELYDLYDEYWGEWRFVPETGRIESENDRFRALHEPLREAWLESVTDLMIKMHELDTEPAEHGESP